MTTSLSSQQYYAAVAVNWSDLYTQGISIDFRLIKDIVRSGFVSAADVQCDVFDLWGGATLGRFVNFLNVESMTPHDSRAFRFKCSYLPSP